MHSKLYSLVTVPDKLFRADWDVCVCVCGARVCVWCVCVYCHGHVSGGCWRWNV